MREALGGIGCDPASTDEANQTIRATIHYTPENSGLRHPWSDRIYLNPSSANREEFLLRMADEIRQGTVRSAIICLNTKHLCNGYTQKLLHYVTAVHIPRGRPAFLHEGQRTESPTDGRVFLYIGSDTDTFVQVFGRNVRMDICLP